VGGRFFFFAWFSFCYFLETTGTGQHYNRCRVDSGFKLQMHIQRRRSRVQTSNAEFNDGGPGLQKDR
jgi:hypothetical protein